jgi:hypothetical protein
MYPFEELNKKISDLLGWYSTWVITSESFSILVGLRSTKLKAVILSYKFQRLILKSSADRKFSESGLTLIELML